MADPVRASARRITVALGVAITAFLVVGALVTELATPTVAFSVLVGIPAGIVAGIAAAVAVYVRFGGVTARMDRLVAAIAGFGYAFLVLSALAYVGVLRPALSIGRTAGLSTLVAVAIYAWTSVRARAAAGD